MPPAKVPLRFSFLPRLEAAQGVALGEHLPRALALFPSHLGWPVSETELINLIDDGPTDRDRINWYGSSGRDNTHMIRFGLPFD